MKILFDQNLSHRLCSEAGDLFQGSAHVHSLGLAESEDRAIWDFARIEGYTIVTLDSDFADMAVYYGPPPKVLWLRAGNQPTSTVAALLRHHADAIAEFANDASSACLELY